MKKTILVSFCFVLGGCQSIGNWADDAGSYLPVLSDERCEHWQCFTAEGKAQSDYNKIMRQQQQQQPDGQQQDANTAPPPPPPPKVDTDPETNPYDNYKP
jgi:hypothetical protein